MTGSCEHVIEPSVSIKCGEFLDQLADFQSLKKYSVLWSLLLVFSMQLN
jgi:hypothetical protein